MNKEDAFVLILLEILYHPRSYMQILLDKFEVTSILRIYREDDLQGITSPPVYDNRYLVFFEDAKVFERCKGLIRYEFMFPVLRVETKSAMQDAVFFCRQNKIPYRIYNNEFSKEDALALIAANCTERVSDAFCKALLKHTKLSPMRILTALDVCSHVGYTVAAVEKYVDTWVYPGYRELIECLLGVSRSKAARQRVLQYLHSNRSWFSFIQKTLLGELDTVMVVYSAKSSGQLGPTQLLDFSDAKGIPRSSLMFALRLYDNVSVAEVVTLREFIKTADLLKVVLACT